MATRDAVTPGSDDEDAPRPDQNRADLTPRTERTSRPEQSGLRARNRADFGNGGGGAGEGDPRLAGP